MQEGQTKKLNIWSMGQWYLFFMGSEERLIWGICLKLGFEVYLWIKMKERKTMIEEGKK